MKVLCRSNRCTLSQSDWKTWMYSAESVRTQRKNS